MTMSMSNSPIIVLIIQVIFTSVTDVPFDWQRRMHVVESELHVFPTVHISNKEYQFNIFKDIFLLLDCIRKLN